MHGYVNTRSRSDVHVGTGELRNLDTPRSASASIAQLLLRIARKGEMKTVELPELS